MKNVAIVGAAGRVGFPLALVLASNGYKVHGIDKNEQVNRMIQSGVVPFVEEKAEEYLRSALGRGTLAMTQDIAAVKEADTVIVVVGTPIDENFNPVLKPLLEAVREMLPHLRVGQLIILRSTVAPGTTEILAQRIESLTNWKVVANSSSFAGRIRSSASRSGTRTVGWAREPHSRFRTIQPPFPSDMRTIQPCSESESEST